VRLWFSTALFRFCSEWKGCMMVVLGALSSEWQAKLADVYIDNEDTRMTKTLPSCLDVTDLKDISSFFCPHKFLDIRIENGFRNNNRTLNISP